MESVNQITLKGKASQTLKLLNVSSKDLSLTLLHFLRLKSIPIASSCNGEGICKKCIFNDQRLSCKINIEDLIEQDIEVTIDYL